MNIAYPFHFDRTGRTASCTDAAHIRDLIEELVLTSPGERVNRPDLGSGLLRLVFSPTSPELATALQFAIQAAIQRWLGDLIDVQRVEVTSVESTVTVAVAYVIRLNAESQTAIFTRPGSAA